MSHHTAEAYETLETLDALEERSRLLRLEAEHLGKKWGEVHRLLCEVEKAARELQRRQEARRELNQGCRASSLRGA